jgi:hypothetical protein
MIRLQAQFIGGGVRHFSGAARRTIALAVRAGVEQATVGLKGDLREQIVAAALGQRLGNAVGSDVYPKKSTETLHPAGRVFPRGKLAEEIFDSFNTGATIRGKSGNWLAIPTRNAYLGGRGGKRPSPGEFEQRTGIKLRLAVPRRSGKGRYQFLVGDSVASRQPGRKAATARRVKQGRKVETLIFFVLVKQTTPGRRLDFAALAQRWADRIPGLIERATPEDLR